MQGVQGLQGLGAQVLGVYLGFRSQRFGGLACGT